MKKINWLLLSILVYIVTIIHILYNRPFSYPEENLLKTIPPLYWLLLILNSTLLIGLTSNPPRKSNTMVFILGIMYGFLFYVTNLYFVIPYEQTDVLPSRIIEFLLSSGKITHEVLSVHSLSYLSYPVSFILEIVIMKIGGIGKIAIYTMGLFVFLGAFYVGLILYYYKKNEDTKFAILSLATYIVLSFHVIVDQVAPQTLALAFLPYLYKLTFDFIEGSQPLKILPLILIFWFTLVFTHPFMFLFYILPVLGMVLYIRISLKRKGIKGSTIGILFSIWGFGFVYLFYNLLSTPLRAFAEQWGETEGETWWVFANFFRKSGAFGPIKYTPHPHYELIPKWIVETQAWVLRIMLVLLVGIILHSFIRYLKRAIALGKPPHQLVFDVFVMISSGVLFILGLITTFLGQRSFQVAFIPFSRYVPDSRTKKAVQYTLMAILIITPVAYTFNTLTNLTVGPQLFVQDEELIIAGYFGNKYLPPHSKVVVARELYPSEYPTKITKLAFPTLLKWTDKSWKYLYYSPKFIHAVEYYGIEEQYKQATIIYIYSNNIVSIIIKTKTYGRWYHG